MRATFRIALVASILPIFAGPAFGQLDVGGTWDLQASAVIPPESDPCVFEGSADVVQDGSVLSGQATLLLVSGPTPPCPPEMMADLDGNVDGDSIFGTLDGGAMFGLLSLQGSVSDDGQSIQGSFLVEEGPFGGVTGTWSAVVQQEVPTTPAIPAAGAWGLGLLTALLALASLLILRRS